MNYLAISFAKQVFDSDSREAERMKSYAMCGDSLHVLVFTKRKENFPSYEQRDNLFVYGTNARTKFGTVFAAILIGRSILKKSKSKKWTVTAQDPFFTSLVMLSIVLGSSVRTHIQIHGDVFSRAYFPNIWKRIAMQNLARFFLHRSDGVRVVSRRIFDSLSVSTKTKATILPIQPILEDFFIVGRERSYGSNKPVSFLYVGRFSAEKNLPALIAAFASAAAGSGAHLTLVGAGLEESVMRETVRKYECEKSVTIRPWVADVALVMAEADVLCLSSSHEGYGLVLVEAMATGMPVITTDVGCAGEVVQHDVHGLVVPIDDEQALSKAMGAYIKDPERISLHGKAGLKEVSSLVVSDEVYLEKYCAALKV